MNKQITRHAYGTPKENLIRIMNKVPILLNIFHKQKVSHYPTVLEYMNKQITRHAYGTPKENLMQIMNKVPFI